MFPAGSLNQATSLTLFSIGLTLFLGDGRLGDLEQFLIAIDISLATDR
jgi:hypothetical protein